MKKFSVIMGIALVAVMTSCNTYKKTKTGLQYKIYSDGKGEKCTKGGFIKYNITKKWKDSLLFSSYDYMPAYQAVDSGLNFHDYIDILNLLRVGDSAMIVQNPDTMRKMQSNLPPSIKKNDKIVTTIKVLAFFNKMEPALADYMSETAKQVERENKNIEAYLKKNNITAVKSPKGIYVSVEKEGTGPAADSGKYVKVMYTGSILGSGTVFDSNVDSNFHHTDPLSFQVGQQGLIAGFNWGMPMLKQGGKGKLYIPPTAGYGINGNPQAGIKGTDVIILILKCWT